MKTKSIVFKASRKLSDGKYGGYAVEVIEEVVLDEDDDLKEAHAEVRQRVISKVVLGMKKLQAMYPEEKE